MLQVNNLPAPLRAFAASRESKAQLGRALTLGIYLTRSREGAKLGVLLEGSLG